MHCWEGVTGISCLFKTFRHYGSQSLCLCTGRGSSRSLLLVDNEKRKKLSTSVQRKYLAKWRCTPLMPVAINLYCTVCHIVFFFSLLLADDNRLKEKEWGNVLSVIEFVRFFSSVCILFSGSVSQTCLCLVQEHMYIIYIYKYINERYTYECWNKFGVMTTNYTVQPFISIFCAFLCRESFFLGVVFLSRNSCIAQILAPGLRLALKARFRRELNCARFVSSIEAPILGNTQSLSLPLWFRSTRASWKLFQAFYVP